MKRLLTIPILSVFIFFSCQQNLPAPNNNSNNSCGNVNLSINGSTVSYNPTQSLCSSGNIISVIGGEALVAVAFISNCSNNMTDYSIQIPGAYSYASINDLVGTSIVIKEASYRNYNCQIMPSNNSYLNTDGVGVLTITSFDNSSNPALISGSFNISDTGKPSVSGTFSNLPCIVNL